jgi:hypothetical protein
MIEEQDYTIDRLTWHTRKKGNEDFTGVFRRQFECIVRFLEDNNLLAEGVASEDLFTSDDIIIRRSHLSALGKRVMKSGYSKWLRYLDKAGNSEKYAEMKQMYRALDKERVS